ncbi:hypothetical protein CLV28_0912 [Sediminihabitans luteus]|uniref:Uncharacterized protein n=1 Tax=Sediminihabitans luteus TaxID=1138585 RepID=A0A2M9D0M4_9CELL|nr:hypothetical protein [Sediminihabitans luteus]PJJ77687.1 hypothetical protein CLV28_0912 [Sediminihabitans luteus]GIJ00086.1 hypothetical protein Slu03_24630 [Sediminihabitans luteus]
MPPASLPPLPLSTAAGYQARHLLVLPGDVLVDEVETLAVSRFAGARWDVVPAGVEPATVAPRTAAPGEPGVLRTSRHTTLTGPFAPGPGLPPGSAMVFDVVTPRERGEAAFPGSGDRDGLGRAFPAGLPEKEERRAVDWLVEAARRLGGSIAVDVPSSGAPGIVLTPDPGVAVDMTLYSDVWLEPDAAQAVLGQVDGRIRLAMDGVDWQGPPAGIADKPLYRGEQMDPAVRKQIHAAADDVDIAALTSGEPLDGYGLLLDLGVDGMIAVEIGDEPDLPFLLRGLPWAAGGAVSYRVRWEPDDLAASQDEFPPMEYTVARKRSAGIVAALAKALHGAVGGEIADEAGFLVEPDDL